MILLEMDDGKARGLLGSLFKTSLPFILTVADIDVLCSIRFDLWENFKRDAE
jgi:hypothetical protein